MPRVGRLHRRWVRPIAVQEGLQVASDHSWKVCTASDGSAPADRRCTQSDQGAGTLGILGIGIGIAVVVIVVCVMVLVLVPGAVVVDEDGGVSVTVSVGTVLSAVVVTVDVDVDVEVDTDVLVPAALITPHAMRVSASVVAPGMSAPW